MVAISDILVHLGKTFELWLRDDLLLADDHRRLKVVVTLHVTVPNKLGSLDCLDDLWSFKP